MQKISFGNKEYIKASEVAKRFKYTQDYVGQLCRSKKVDARLVGRIWYVEPSSVTAYRKTKHTTQKTEAAKVKFNKKAARVQHPKPVQPVVRSKTAKTTRAVGGSATPIAITYGNDEQSVIPVLSTEPTSVPVTSSTGSATESDPAPAPVTPPTAASNKKLKIKMGSKRQTKFASEKIPEISLSGKLKVNDLYEEDLPKSSQEVIDHTPTAEDTPQKPEAKLTFAEKVAAVETTKSAKSPEPTIQSDQNTVTAQSDALNITRPAFAPTMVQPTTRNRGVFASIWLPVVISLVCSVLVGVVLISVQSVSLVEGSDSQQTLQFDLQKLTSLLLK